MNNSHKRNRSQDSVSLPSKKIKKSQTNELPFFLRIKINSDITSLMKQRQTMNESKIAQRTRMKHQPLYKKYLKALEPIVTHKNTKKKIESNREDKHHDNKKMKDDDNTIYNFDNYNENDETAMIEAQNSCYYFSENQNTNDDHKDHITHRKEIENPDSNNKSVNNDNNTDDHENHENNENNENSNDNRAIQKKYCANDEIINKPLQGYSELSKKVNNIVSECQSVLKNEKKKQNSNDNNNSENEHSNNDHNSNENTTMANDIPKDLTFQVHFDLKIEKILKEIHNRCPQIPIENVRMLYNGDRMCEIFTLRDYITEKDFENDDKRMMEVEIMLEVFGGYTVGDIEIRTCT